MKMVPQWQLRADFARRLSDIYGREVPAYATLVKVSREVNDDVLRTIGAEAERFGSIARVTAERHGAIRVGTPGELRDVATIFAALGMHPVGFYDLRAAASSAVPVVATAFRPIAADELARNPFRMFSSMLTTDDPRFFDTDLRARLEAFLASRQLFCPEVLELAAIAENEGELSEINAKRFLDLAVGSFELSPEPIDRSWYEELEHVSAVAADIGGVRSMHVNHLTPRVLNIDELYRRMSRRGIQMIDAIQGPPSWDGPDVLLRQTSFRALAEPRVMRDPDGSVTPGSLRVRFGEVEARGIALTPAGRARYDAMLEEIDELAAGHPAADRADLARAVWERGFPATERGLLDHELAYFEYRPVGTGLLPRSGTVTDLLDRGLITAEPITYEDFLPRSAAGIFQSNLTDAGTRDDTRLGARYDAEWLSAVLDRPVHDPFELYKRQQQRSVELLFRPDGEPILA